MSNRDGCGAAVTGSFLLRGVPLFYWTYRNDSKNCVEEYGFGKRFDGGNIFPTLERYIYTPIGTKVCSVSSGGAAALIDQLLVFVRVLLNGIAMLIWLIVCQSLIFGAPIQALHIEQTTSYYSLHLGSNENGDDSASIVNCALLPDGWLLPHGRCKRFFTRCSHGQPKRTDCYMLIGAASPFSAVDPHSLVFNERTKRCTVLEQCAAIGESDRGFREGIPVRYGHQKPQAPASITSENVVPLPTKCMPGLSYAIASCSGTYKRCNQQGLLQSVSCPPGFLFHPTVRACLLENAACHQSSTTQSLRMLEDVERDLDESISERKPAAEMDEDEPKSAPSKRIGIFESSAPFKRVAPFDRKPPFAKREKTENVDRNDETIVGAMNEVKSDRESAEYDEFR
ncbi:unnamed protein product [Anisakis simplex]|uniref:Chitin-binding type-2 domain-containing protein n=1 Tax=Anisakis simplex TaxID=6269 RepID=A0A0M3K8Y0_ANISI|nr:unnamed protein product [Anisakis simplex]